MTSVQCTACGNAVAPGAKFCSECGAPQALACPACGSPHAPGAKFCAECGTPLVTIGHKASPPPRATGSPASSQPATSSPVAERRLVSVLFADLVGFTTLSESRDAEEVRELLSRYFDTARTVIERYGGTVEKFIGDAVMAVWGTPVAQEDDAERAVRAGMELAAAVTALGEDADSPGLRARVGVLTGEAAVTLGAEGQGMVAGDLVNTAARIQSAAAPGTVLVGETTMHATEAALVYEDAGEHELKGKAEPARLFRAVRIVAARRGEGRSTGLEAPFVGRDRELRLVKDLFHATADDRRASLVSVIGVAGIGKSRLAWEFEKYIDGLADDVWWHRGRCLSYGDGVAYWALAEMVRMRAQITEDEPREEAMRKLRQAVETHVPDEGEREWVEPHLRHLLGLGERITAEQQDLFSAWRLFFERMSARGAVALVFEDLHWADAGLLDFVEHLLEWSRSHPIYVLALSRPDLAERHPSFGTRVRSATTLTLEPLPDEDMGALLRGLVPGLTDDVLDRIRSRADGIPLYAVETVRMLLDRGALERDGDGYRIVGELESLDVPQTLHALIASRLDSLEALERRVLEDAAVLGKTFAAKGVAALSGMPEEDLAPTLASLVRKEMLVLDTDPRSPERGQYGFLQALVQRVAYETLSRHERRARHLAAAGYLEHGAGIDPDEIAEVIAAHHVDAYEADTSADDAEGIKAAARSWLCRAGERAASLASLDDARRAFDDAAELADDPTVRAPLLERAGHLAIGASEFELARARLEEAHRLFEQAGRTHDQARTAARLSLALWSLGQSEEAVSLMEPAFATLATDEPDADVAALAAELARIHYFLGNPETAMERVEFALDIAEAQELPLVLSEALNTKALIVKSHQHESRALMREALEIALEHDLVEAALRAYNNLMFIEWQADRPDQLRRMNEAALELARTRGMTSWVTNFAGSLSTSLLEDSEWDEAFAVADEMPARVSAVPSVALTYCELARASWLRGDPDGVDRWLALVAPEIDGSSDIQRRGLSLWRQSIVARREGRTREAFDLLEATIGHVLESDDVESSAQVLEDATSLARALDDPDAALTLVAAFDDVPPARRTRLLDMQIARARANAASRAGEDDQAAELYATALAAARNLGKTAFLGPVLYDYGRWLSDSGRPTEAEPLLAEARDLFTRMRAAWWLERLDAVAAPEPSRARA